MKMTHHSSFSSYLDDDLTLKCLAAKINSKSKYIKVFPIECEAKIADSAMCLTPFKQTTLQQVKLS